ncbi:MAG: hypothetical protein KTR31_21200 [Myxococcales bacterium]|nr:hypothetical protein [Myxococcales bacterium]
MHILVLGIPLGHAAPEIGAIVRPEVVVDVASDRNLEDFATVHTWSRVFARDETPRGDKWFLEARLQHHLLLGASQVDVNGTDVEAYYELGLGPTGIDARLGGPSSPARLRLGALRERWGKLDLLPVLDVLNPSEGRTGPLTPPDWQRIPVPMAVLKLGKGNLRSETVLIPFANADRLWLRETDWSLVRQGMMAGLFEDMQQWEGAEASDSLAAVLPQAALNAKQLDPSYRRGLDGAVNGNALPQALVGNGEIAQRFELAGSSYDLALMAGLLRSNNPQAILDDSLRQFLIDERLPDTEDLIQGNLAVDGGALKATWPRTGMVGLEGSALVGPLQVRADGGYFTHHVVRTDYASATTVPKLAAGVGVDYVRGSTFQATLEGRWQHLFDPPDDLVLAIGDQIQIAAGVRGGILAERLWIQVGGAYDVSFNELYARPSVTWRASDAVQLELGAVILEGFEFAPPDTLIDALTYRGGPASFWSQNDSVTLAVSWIL